MAKEKHTILAPIGLGLIVLAGAFLLSSDTHATDYTLSLSSSGSQFIDVSNMGDKTAISADNLNVATNCRYGYNLTLSTSVNNNNLYLNGNSSNNTTGTYFFPVNGTTSLKNSPNTWGYYYNSSTPTTAPTSSSIFSPVPTLSNPATIKTPLTTPSSSDINDNFNIYYGVASSDDMPVGTYKLIPDTNNSGNDGTLVYNATISDSCIAYTVHFNPSSYFEGNLITGTGTVADQTIYEGVATPLTTSTFTVPSGYYFAGWNTAQDGSGTSYTSGQSVTDLTTVGSTITLYAMWTDCPGGNICYKANASNVEGEMDNQIIDSPATETILRIYNYRRAGYGFAGWSAEPNGTGELYGPQESINVTPEQYATGGLNLYAIWIESTGTIQDWSGCNNLVQATYDTTNGKMVASLSNMTALTDARDGNTYTVGRLADGKCWMTENLRLGTDGSENDSLAQGFGDDTANNRGRFIGLANPEVKNFTGSSELSAVGATTPANSIYYTETQEGTASIDIGRVNYASFRIPRYNDSNTNANSSYKQYGYGNYYSWPAAIASTGYYDGYNKTVSDTSICPSGWRLPYGYNINDGATPGGFSYLDTQMGGTGERATSSTSVTGIERFAVWRQFPNNYVISGYFSGSSVALANIETHYWSSASNSMWHSFGLSFINRSVFSPGTDYNHKYYGYSVRCISDV